MFFLFEELAQHKNFEFHYCGDSHTQTQPNTHGLKSNYCNRSKNVRRNNFFLIMFKPIRANEKVTKNVRISYKSRFLTVRMCKAFSGQTHFFPLPPLMDRHYIILSQWYSNEHFPRHFLQDCFMAKFSSNSHPIRSTTSIFLWNVRAWKKSVRFSNKC